MAKVFLHKPLSMDKHLGKVNDDGRVYHSDPGPDDRVGYVDLRTGKVYSRRLGPDQEIGWVDEDGKVYAEHFGPDDYTGRVHVNGRMHLHKSLAGDEYVGHLDRPQSIRHTAAAFLLLVIPALVDDEEG